MSIASTSSQRRDGTSSRSPNFLLTLWSLLAKSPPSPYLFWSECGHFVLIPDEDAFVEQVARILFNQGNIASFNKQMNNWGFLRAPRARAHTSLSRYHPDTRVWKHETLLQSSSIHDVQRVRRRPDGLHKKKRAPKRVRRDYKDIAPGNEGDHAASTSPETSGASSPVPASTALPGSVPALPLQLDWSSTKFSDFEQASKPFRTTTTAYAPWPAAYFNRCLQFSTASDASSASSYGSPASDTLTSPPSYDIDFDPGLSGNIGYAPLLHPIGHQEGGAHSLFSCSSTLSPAPPNIRYALPSALSNVRSNASATSHYPVDSQPVLNFSPHLATLTQLEAMPVVAPPLPSSQPPASTSGIGKPLSRDPSFGYARAPGWNDAMLSGPLTSWNGLGTSDSSQN